MPVADKATGTTGKFEALVEKFTEPVTPPGAVGFTLTGTVSVSPLTSLTGNLTFLPPLVTVPVMNGFGAADRPGVDAGDGHGCRSP